MNRQQMYDLRREEKKQKKKDMGLLNFSDLGNVMIVDRDTKQADIEKRKKAGDNCLLCPGILVECRL